MKKTKLLLITLSLLLTFSFSTALAQNGSDLDRNNDAFLEQAGLGTSASISEIVSDIIKVFLSLLGIIFIVLIVYAGFMWMTSAGNEERVSKAKKIIAAAIVGLAIVLSAYAITYFVIDQILEATQGGTGLD